MRIKKLSNLLIVFLILPYLFCGSAHAKGVKAKHRHPQSKNYYLLKNVEYANTDGESLKLDLYRPTIMGGRLPVIIQIHGGGFRGGDKSPCPMIGPFIKNGYAVASLNYRLRDKGTFPNSVCDVKSAVRWLRANADKYNLAINRFGAIGGSAGGYLVAMLGTTGNIKDFDKGENLEYPCNVQAVVDLYGIGDFSTLAQDRIDIGVTLDGDINAQADYFGCESFANCPDLTKASPISYVSGEDRKSVV